MKYKKEDSFQRPLQSHRLRFPLKPTKMNIIKNSTPIARKEHQCDCCGCKIVKGQKYHMQTNVIDGTIYNWKEHEECLAIARKLGMFDDIDPDYGLSSDEFIDSINQYVYDEHYDENIGDIAVEWQNLTYYQTICKILKELESEKEETPRPAQVPMV